MTTVWPVQYTDTKELYGIFASRDAALAHIERDNSPCELRCSREISDFFKIEVRSAADNNTSIAHFMLYETTVLG